MVPAALAALIATLVLAACGGSSHKQTHTSAGSRSTTTGRTSTPTVKPLAAAQDVAGTAPGDPMRVTIYDLRRNGPFVTLDFGIQCLDPNSGCATIGDFDPQFESASEESTYSYTAAGVSLVDPVGNKQYWPVLDAQQHPDSSRLPGSIIDSNIHLAWVTFLAPPASVNSLDVLLPRGGPAIPAVPITSAAAPSARQIGATAVPAAATEFSASGAGTSGLTLPVQNLVLTVGNPAGSDSESANKDTFSLRADVLFQFARANLTPGATAILDHVAAQIKARALGPVRVSGYTDSIGTDAVNIPLSKARARSVVNALRAQTPGITYQAQGFGSADPVAPNTKRDGSDNPAGRALNRRVTISFAVKAPAKPTPPPSSAPVPQSATGSAQSVTYTAASGVGTSTYAVGVSRMFRTGGLAVLELRITCQSGVASTHQCLTSGDFAGTPTVPPLPANSVQQGQLLTVHLDTLSGIYLVDPTGAEYIPVTNSGDDPLTTPLNANASPGASFPVWIYFPAPPSTASTVSVVMPGGSARITGVPIATSAP